MVRGRKVNNLTSKYESSFHCRLASRQGNLVNVIITILISTFLEVNNMFIQAETFQSFSQPATCLPHAVEASH